ncbi:MAG: hypothetical protein IJW64_02075 [Clostridia bacterium]|nr:hypothetical protein [Clostridia bacterium]
MNSKTKKEITDALKKKAVGFDTFETVEEFAESDGEIRLVKKKVTKKTVPPDVSAVKLLLDIDGESSPISSLSDEELEKERAKLIKILEGKLKNENRKMQN